MGIALFAGIPSRYLQRTKNVLQDAADRLNDWQFYYITAPRGPELQVRDMKRIVSEAQTHGSLHVIGLSAERNRRDVASAISPYFRFRWFDHVFLPYLDNPDPSPFVDRLQADLEEEREWAMRVQPNNLTSALLLPKSSFTCSTQHECMWDKATRFGSEDSVDAAEKAIQSFTANHHQRVVFSRKGEQSHPEHMWADNRSLIFDVKGPRHAIAPSPRNWKYSYLIEEGFHYDVTHRDKNGFSLSDFDGVRHTKAQSQHINIDPHGHVR